MSSNRTTQRALQILCLLAKRPDGMTLSEISLELEMPKTSAFDILQTLRQEHFLRETHKRFSIGYMAHEVGRSYQPDRDLYGIVRPELPPLGDKFGMTASLVFHEEEGLVYALEYRPANSIVSSGASSGYSFIHASASGKAIFAFRFFSSAMVYLHIVLHRYPVHRVFPFPHGKAALFPLTAG